MSEQNVVGSLQGEMAALMSEPSGRIPVIERRLDSHQDRLNALSLHVAKVPEVRMEAVEKRVERLIWFAGLMIGGGTVIMWMIDRCITLLQLAVEAKR